MKHVRKAALATVLLAPWGVSQAVELSDDLSLYLDAGIYSECLNYMGFDDVCSATLMLGVNKAF